MHCHISLYLQTNTEEIFISTAKYHYISKQLQTKKYMNCQFLCIYRQLQTNSTYALPQFILFTDNCRPTHFMHRHISLFLQTRADQLNICNASFHFIYSQLQTNTLYALQHFTVFPENCRRTKYMHCHISLYLQKSAEQINLCTATCHCIYRQLQTI